MKEELSSQLPSLLVTSLLLLCCNAVWGASELRPVINGGQSFCNPLRSGSEVSGHEGIACMRFPQDGEHLDVEVYTGKEGWEIEDALLWIGTERAGEDENVWTMDFDGFPLIRRDVGKEMATFRISLQDEMGFSCQNNVSDYWTAVRATIRSHDKHDKLDLRVWASPGASKQESDRLVPFQLSCKEFSVQQIAAPQNRIRHINGKATSTHRRLRGAQNCPTPRTQGSVRLNLTETNLTQSLTVAELMIVVNRPDVGCIKGQINEQRAIYDRFDGFWDINDQALVAKTRDDGVCYFLIMGTEGLNPFDQLQNLFFYQKVMDNSDCAVRYGFYDAYNTTYKDELRKSVDSCVASCAGQQCPLVIGGHSQGGAAAIVAAVDLRHYHPTVITYGSPRPFLLSDEYPCTDFDGSRHFQYVNTLIVDGSCSYDRVAMGTTTGSDHLGEILLLDDVNWPIAAPGNDNQREPREAAAHNNFLYLDRIKNMVSRGCFPVPAGEWPAPQPCTQNDECVGNCIENKCTG